MPTPQEIDQLVLRAFGPTGDQFRGVFREAKNRLGQEGDPNLDPNQVGGAALEFGKAFANEYFRQTGQLPDEGLVKEFVGTNLNTPEAEGFLKGSFAGGQQTERARDYIEGLDPTRLPAKAANPDPTGLEARKESLGEMVKAETEAGTQDINDQYGKLRTRAIDSAGARVAQPNFQGVLQGLDQEQGRSIANLIQGIRGKAAGLNFDAETRAREFGVNTGLAKEGLNLQKKSLAQQILASREGQSQNAADRLMEMRLAERLGKSQGDEEGNNAGLGSLIGGGLGGGIGAFLGGPAGAGAGFQIGSALGGVGGSAVKRRR